MFRILIESNVVGEVGRYYYGVFVCVSSWNRAAVKCIDLNSKMYDERIFQ